MNDQSAVNDGNGETEKRRSGDKSPIPRFSDSPIRRRLLTERGLTVLEVVVAFGIFLVVLSMAFAVFHASLDAAKSSEKRLQALALAQAALEKAKTLPLSQLPPQSFEVQDVPLTVRLAHLIIAGSEQLRWSDGSAFEGEYHINAETGELTLTNAKRTGTLEVSYRFVIEQTPNVKVVLQGARWQLSFKRLTATATYREGRHQREVSLFLVRGQ